jgi:IS30 family transposase
MKRFRHLTRTDRIRIEALLLAGMSGKDIATELGVAPSTICYEKKKGSYIHRNSDWTEEVRYSADLADMRTRQNETGKGPQLKIGNDRKLAEYIERRISVDRYSPAAVLGEIREKGLKFSVTIHSPNTIYSYIDKGIFLNLTNKDLPVRGKKKRTYNKVRAVKRRPMGESIEQRPVGVRDRNSFGHWEMDTVVSARPSNKALLVLTERLTRREIIRLLPDKTTASVVRALDQIELGMGGGFRDLFKTITCDNGTEFSDAAGIERSVFGGCRTKTYFCHPYSSYERGSNENVNKLIRRWQPKGSNFDNITESQVQIIEDWVNQYPRKLHGWRSSEELFQGLLPSCIN